MRSILQTQMSHHRTEFKSDLAHIGYFHLTNFWALKYLKILHLMTITRTQFNRCGVSCVRLRQRVLVLDLYKLWS